MSESAGYESLRQRVQDHLQTLEERSRGMELPFYQAILEYLIREYRHPEHCTLREMERALGLPYTRLKRFIERLEEELVLEEYDFGSVKPFRLANLGKAMQLGYINPDLNELKKWAWLPFSEPVQTGIVPREWLAVLLSDFPGLVLAGAEVADHPLNVSEAAVAFAVLESSETDPEIRTDITRGIEKLQAQMEQNPARDAEYVRQFENILEQGREIARLNPEALDGLRDFLDLGMGSREANILAYLYTVSLPGSGGGGPLFWPKGIWSREIFFEMGAPDTWTDEDAMDAACRVAVKQLKLLMRITRATLALIAQNGVDHALSTLNQPRQTHQSGHQGWVETKPSYTRAHLLYQVIPLGCAALVALGFGAPGDLLADARELIRSMRQAVSG